jgi:glycosyltransferase involved in cell wall biosynthesis
MKLLFVLGDISASGGTERATAEITSALSEAGHAVEIVSLFGPARPYFNVRPEIKVRAAGLKEARGSLFRLLRISRRMYSECRASKADVIVLVDTILFAFCVPWLAFLRSRIVCWEHFNLSTDHGSTLREVARLAAAKLGSRIVVLTDRDASAWRARFRINTSVQAIWNPIPRFDDQPASPFEQPVVQRRVVLAVGRLSYEKAFDVLLQAWRLLGNAKYGWVLRIVGAGDQEGVLKELADKLEVSESVEFPGHSRDIAAEYRNATVYVMSSRREGLPMTLLEAQHFGLPSVSTDCVTGPREILSCDNGLLVPVENPAMLADGLSAVMTDPGLRQRLSQAARLNAGRFDVNAIRERWESLFDELQPAR